MSRFVKAEGVNHVDMWRRNGLDGENSVCKSPKVAWHGQEVTTSSV